MHYTELFQLRDFCVFAQNKSPLELAFECSFGRFQNFDFPFLKE